VIEYNEKVITIGETGMRTKARATIEDLYKVEGKAELVNGEIVHMPPTGDEPGYAGDAVYRKGDIADAEPAVPGWQMAVNDLFATP
jgi:hypothetical protein